MVNPDHFQELKQKLSDREWRLDNLYWIQNEKGEAVRFVRNDAQREYWSNLWYLNICLKARQLGMSSLVAIIILDSCLFSSNTAAGIIDYTLPDATKKLAKIKFAYDRLPELLKKTIPLVKQNTQEMEFGNGSSVQVGTSHRGGTLQILHVSELGKISAMFPDKAREIKTGAFGTVHPGQFIHVESTAEGIGGEFHDMVKRAGDLQKQGKPLTELSFKLHFFPWWKHRGYQIRNHSVPISAELQEYFAGLEARGIKLTPEQQFWYAEKRSQLGPDDILREYPSTEEESFQASVEGAYFKQQMSKARIEGRIGQVPFDPNRKVNTFWDIGVGDQTSIWFHQSDGVRHRLIDYYENSGEGLAHYAGVLEKKAQERGFSYGTHYGPHDLTVREWGSNAKPRVEAAAELGVKFEVVGRVDNKNDAIEATRSFLALTWIDETHCERGIQCLDNYRKEWDERLATWRPRPLHDYASHGSDALMTGVIGFVPDIVQPVRDRHRRPQRSSRSSWAA